MNAYDSETICITGSDFDRNSAGLQLNRVVGGSISGCEFLEDWHNGMWIATGSENTAVSGSEFDEDYGSCDTMRGQCACKRIGVQGEHTYGPLPWKRGFSSFRGYEFSDNGLDVRREASERELP